MHWRVGCELLPDNATFAPIGRALGMRNAKQARDALYGPSASTSSKLRDSPRSMALPSPGKRSPYVEAVGGLDGFNQCTGLRCCRRVWCNVYPFTG